MKIRLEIKHCDLDCLKWLLWEIEANRPKAKHWTERRRRTQQARFIQRVITHVRRNCSRRDRESRMRYWISRQPAGLTLLEMANRAQAAGFYSRTSTDFIMLERIATEMGKAAKAPAASPELTKPEVA